MSITIRKTEVTEFQRAAAIVAYDSCIKTMATKDLEQLIFNKVHGIEGNNESVSQLELLVSGNSIHFDRLWRSEVIQTSDPQQNSITQRVLVDIYSPSRGIRRLIATTDVTYELLGRARLTGKDKVTGRTLLNQALDVIKHGKKALAYSEEYLSNGKDPSGHNETDLLEYVVCKMWEELEKKGSGAVRKQGYTFPGYVAFCLFVCPLVTRQNHRLKSFSTGNECVTGKADGRAAARATEIRPANKRGKDNDGNPRLTFAERIQLQSINQQEICNREDNIKRHERTYVDKMNLLLQKRRGLMQSQTTAITLLSLFQQKDDGSVRCDSQLQKLDALEQRIEQVDIDMKNLEEKHKLDEPTIKEKEKSLNLLYKTKARSTSRTKKSSSTPTTKTAVTTEGGTNTSSLTTNNNDNNDNNGVDDSNTNTNNAGTTIIDNNNNTSGTTSTATNNNDSNETAVSTPTNNNNNALPLSGYENYQCWCAAIPNCKLNGILSAPVDFLDATNISKYKCKVCEMALHAVCYEEGGDNRCFKCKNAM